jgi:hypothetical protein
MTLTRPSPGDPLSSSNGKPSTQILDEAFDLVDAHEQALEGPVFTNASAQTAVLAETLINDGTAGSINPGSWTATGVQAGTGQGFKNVSGRTYWDSGKMGLGEGFTSFQESQFNYALLDFATPVQVGTQAVLKITLAYQPTGTQPGPRFPSEVFEVVASDGATLSGTVVRTPLPIMLMSTFYDVYLLTQGLTSVACVGVRQIDSVPYPDASETMSFWFDSIAWATATELDVAKASTTSSTVLVPANYVPGVAQRRVETPSRTAKLDLRPGEVTLSGFDGVRRLRDWETGADVEQGGAADYVIDQAIRDLQEGETLQFTRGAKYDLASVTIRNKKNITIDGNGATFYHLGSTGGMWILEHVNDCTFRNMRLVFTHANYGTGVLPGSNLVDIGLVGTAAVVTSTMTLTGGAMATTPEPAWQAEDEDGFIRADFTLSTTASTSLQCFIELGQSSVAPPTTFTYDAWGGKPAGSYYYWMTYVYADGRESGLSRPARAAVPTTWGRVHMALPVPTTPIQGTPIIAKRIYCGTSANSANAGVPIAEVPVYWTSFVDNTATTAVPTYALTLPGAVDAAGSLTPTTYAYYVTQVDTTTGRERAVDPQGLVKTNIHGRRLVTVVNGGATLTLPSWTGVSKMRIYRTISGSAKEHWTAGFIAELSAGEATFTDTGVAADLSQAPPFWPVNAEIPEDAIAPSLPSVRLTLTTTPTTYTVKMRPNERTKEEMLNWRIGQVNGTTATITIHNWTDYTGQRRTGNSQLYGGVDRRDNQHGFAITEGPSSGNVFENIDIQKPLGDGFFFQAGQAGMKNHTNTIRDCNVFANGRQGLSLMSGGPWLIERSRFAACGGQGIDVEWEYADRGELVLNDVEFVSPKVSHIAIQDVIFGIKMRNVRCSTRYNQQGIVSIVGAGIEIVDCDFGFIQTTLTGTRVFIDGLVAGKLTVTGSSTLQTFGGGWQGRGGSIIRHVRLTPTLGVDEPLNVSMPNCTISDITTAYPFDAFPVQFTTAPDSSGPFQIAELATVARSQTDRAMQPNEGPQSNILLDPGPWKTRYPQTWKGTILAEDAWFPTGLDLKSEPTKNVRAVSSTSTAGNNLRGSAVVAAGALTMTVPFPTRAYPDLTFISAAASAGTGTLNGTVFWAVASRRTTGGPRPAIATTSVALVAPTNASLQLGNFLTSDTFLEGFTLYRGAASGVYTTRYDVFPYRPIFSMNVSNTGGRRTVIDRGTELRLAWTGHPISGYTQILTPTPSASHADWDGSKWLHSTDQTGWEPDTAYTVVPVASWDTTVAVTAKRMNGFDVHFGVACPVGGGTLDWLLIR